ncbi:hypothetical protein PHYC_02334 [Phycisphaerales bacterium]|nr:hypothetical protein PHYC_02334 [Phycisphaerales bacterium]
MGERNHERVLAVLLRELAGERGIAVESLGEGWILRLTRGGVVRYVHGYAFDLNTAATHAIACDKAATSEVLRAAGIARVEHRLFLHPDLAPFVKHPGNWRGMLEFFEACGRDAVVKDNTGTGGRDVHRARSALELEAGCLTLFERGHDVALSPFVEIEEETRLVMLEGRCEAAYSKVRPSVTGDGARTVLELLAERVTRGGMTAEWSRFLGSLGAEGAAVLRERPGAGVVRLLNWRHNLGQGASVLMEDAGSAGMRSRVELAKCAGAALNLVFGSVDVVRVGGREMVLEVNSGVMMEAIAGAPGGRDLARRVYGRAVELMFADKVAPAP